MERATRYSKKREAILTAIRSSDAHPSAEWIYHTLKAPTRISAWGPCTAICYSFSRMEPSKALAWSTGRSASTPLRPRTVTLFAPPAAQ